MGFLLEGDKNNEQVRYVHSFLRALSSVGRAFPSHGRGRRFDPCSAHHAVLAQLAEQLICNQ